MADITALRERPWLTGLLLAALPEVLRGFAAF
jgi:hypothetical protein